MKRRRHLFVPLAGVLVAVLFLVRPWLLLQAGAPASEHYRLTSFETEATPVEQPLAETPDQGSEHYQRAASGIGEVPAAMESEGYQVNDGIVSPAEVAPPADSESYHGGGIVPWRVNLPVVLRASG
jgi:hypothetical protein